MLAATLSRPVPWDDVLRGMVLAPVAEVLLKAARLRGDGPAGEDGASALAAELKGLRLPVTGIGDERQCQVQRGGVAVEALDPATGQVRAVPGLFVVGEAADVDAPCGGYNLHWAWTSGLLAGRAAASAVAEGVHS